MKTYAHYGFSDFIICLGYKGYYIKEYFANYYLHESDVTFDFKNSNKCVIHSNTAESWKVTLVNTGLNTMTGGRVKRIQKYVGNEPFLMTYGDGVSDVDINKLIKFHGGSKKIVTVTAVKPMGRFGAMVIDKDNTVKGFQEKPKDDNSWISAGFFVLQPEIFDKISEDNTVLEKDTFEKLARENKLSAYKHEGFWHPMDTMRDKLYLEEQWQTGNAPWKVWDR